MSLSKSSLTSALETMFKTKTNPATMSKHFQDFSKLYDDYAKEAVEGGASNTLLTTGKSSFQSTMSTYSNFPSTLLSYSNYIELACIAYWNSSVFSTTKIPLALASITSITIIPMVSMSLQTNLLKAINDAEGDPTSLANKIAEELDSVTKTVKVTIVGPNKAVPPVVTTISNLPIS